MARYRRYRKYFKYPRKKWSANIKPVPPDTTTVGAGSFFLKTVLCENPAQSDNTVSQQFTVKNPEFTFEFDSISNGLQYIEALTCYIMFVPQGMTVTETYPVYHPEYIMASRFIGSPNNDSQPNRNALKISSRLARRLQTGDQIIFLITGTNESDTGYQLSLRGLLRWWTKAN